MTVSKQSQDGTAECSSILTLSERMSLRLFRGLKCHSVLICNNRKSKCRCRLNGNEKDNEYETRVTETERGTVKKGWRKDIMLRH